jgi:hypothetical protein
LHLQKVNGNDSCEPGIHGSVSASPSGSASKANS